MRPRRNEASRTVKAGFQKRVLVVSEPRRFRPEGAWRRDQVENLGEPRRTTDVMVTRNVSAKTTACLLC